MRILKNLLEGLLSLGSLGGDNSLFNDYLKGDNASDLRKDWETIGNDMRKVMNLKQKYSESTSSRILTVVLHKN